MYVLTIYHITPGLLEAVLRDTPPLDHPQTGFLFEKSRILKTREVAFGIFFSLSKNLKHPPKVYTIPFWGVGGSESTATLNFNKNKGHAQSHGHFVSKQTQPKACSEHVTDTKTRIQDTQSHPCPQNHTDNTTVTYEYVQTCTYTHSYTRDTYICKHTPPPP